MCVCKMPLFCVILVLANFFNCVSLEHVWHSYQYDPNHQNREELTITNITADDQFKFNYVAKSWKSLCDDQICYLVGFSNKNVFISLVTLNKEKNEFLQQKSQEINFEENITDIAIFQNWNSSLQDLEIVIVIALTTELFWYKLGEPGPFLFWVWPINKNISHINFFEIEYDTHILIINQHFSQTTADLYQFELKDSPNFWLRQKLQLSDFAQSSAVVTSGPDYFMAIPQKSLNQLSIYKTSDNHFISYKNLTSGGITSVVSFTCGHKSFFAINGMNAGIYRLVKRGFLKENLSNSHFSGVNFWLPMDLSVYGDDFMLIAQRSLFHGGHKSFAVEVIAYNGDKFEEHDDIHCLYYGEEVLGLSCLPDEGGIEGSALINIDNNLGLVVPRKNRSSDLFLIKTEIRQIPNPLDQQLQDLIKRKNEINNLINIQEERYNELVAKSQQVFDLDSVSAKLDEMNANVLIMKEQIDSSPTHYTSVIFNNVVEIKSNVTAGEVQVGEIGEELANTLLEDIVLRDNIGVISGPKFIKNLETEDLLFENINGINSNQLLYDSENITIDGDLVLENHLIVRDLTTDQVNGAKFEDQVINLEAPIDEEIIFENVKTDKAAVQKLNDHFIPTEAQINESGQLEFESLFIPLNVTVDQVNGENFDSFLSQLCLRNIRNYIPGLVNIEGDVIVEGDARIEYLNNLKFPYEYVFTDNIFPNITGVKTFNKLVTSEVNCEGTINGINTSQFITRTTDQSIPQTTTFKNLKITESLNVDGEIIGEHASKFLPNPTLLKTDFVTAKCHFKNLEVEGLIVLSDSFNGKNFKSMLSDVVYSSEEEPFIEGLKTFPEGLTVRKNLIISSNSVTNVNLDSIVTKNTDQVLNLSVLDGIVTFGNVEIGGFYDSVNITKLDEDLVKLDGEQYISSTLIFEDELTVNKLEAEIVRRKDRFFDALDVENCVVEGDFEGKIQGFDLEEFNQNRMSFTEDQTVEADFELGHSFVTSISVNKLNNVDCSEFSSDSLQLKLVSKIVAGKVDITNLSTKSLEVDKIDNKSTMSLGGALDITKHNLTNLVFNDDVSFETVEIEKFGGVDFTTFVTNIVYKNETHVTFSGAKTFPEGFTVHKLIETQKINNVVLPNILRNYGVQEIAGPLTVEGNVQFGENLTVGTLNDVSVQAITDSFQVNDSQIRIKGDVLFARLPHIHNLHINSAQQFLDGMIYTDDNFRLQGRTTFKNLANFEKNIRVVGKINNIDLPSFVSDMVMITKDATIKSTARFTKPTFIDHMIVNNNLKTHDLNNVNLTSWVVDAIFVNQGLMKGKFTFENVTIVDNLRTDFINDVNIDTLVPLKTQQNLTQLCFKTINLFEDLPVGNSTNFHNLPKEFENTVLLNTVQEIDSDVEFAGNVFIENDLQLTGLLNEMEIERIVTTNTDQELTGVYHFKSKVNIGDDLIVEGLVNGINVTEWDSEGVKISAPYTQNITENWVIEQDLVLEETTGSGTINGLNFAKFSREIAEKRSYKYAMEKALVDDYTNICKDLTYMRDQLQNQIYKFSYLENLQMLNFQNEIEQVFSFEDRDRVFLLISERKNCESYLFTFGDKFRFVQSLHFGLVAQIIPVRVNNLLYLVVRNQAFYSTCKVQGTNLWQVIDNHFVHVANIDEQELLQESLVPGVFYGISGNEVTEFKVLTELDTVVRYRKWQVDEDNLAFVPRGFATGLALRTGRKLIRLQREDPIVEDFNYETEKIIRGNCTEEFNPFFPGRKGSDLVVMKVGIRSNKRSLLAVASHEETSVRGSLDFIKIYEDVFEGKMFHKVATYKPSSLQSLEFKNGETFLVFLEDQSVLQVYEYKGIEGFKHKLSSKIQGTELITIGVSERKLIGVVDKNKLSFMEAIMLGNQLEENLQCTL
ncbi:uncharacterized protein fs(1)N [Tribolium castaneum]|uniref:uncharacterized protein fs(1)N n=1 Tax=Tribolium castaneum TaxID=7070 RepID=UPI0030FEE8A4